MMRHLLATILACIVLVHTGKAQFKTPTNWDWQYPKLFEGNFNSVTKVSDGIVAVGDKSSIIKSKDAGSSWTQIALSVETDLVSIRFLPDEKTGYIFGKTGEIFKSTNSGNTWTADATFPATADLIYNASFYQDTVAVYYRNKSDGENYLATITTGQNWQTTKLAGTIDNASYPFYWSNRYNGYRDSFYYYNKYVFRDRFDNSISNIAWFPASGELIIGCNYSNYPNIYDYKSGEFTPRSVGSNTKGKIFAYDENTFYIITNFTNEMMKTTDGGKTFKSLGNPPFINDILFIDDFEAYAACNNSQVIATVNGGSLWTNTEIHDETKFQVGTDMYSFSIMNITKGKNNIIYGWGRCVRLTGGYLAANCIVSSEDFGKTWKLVKLYQNSTVQNKRLHARRFIALDSKHFIVMLYDRTQLASVDVGFMGYPPAYIEYHYTDGDLSSPGMFCVEPPNKYNGIVDMHPFDNKSGVCVGYDADQNKSDCIMSYEFDVANQTMKTTLLSNSLPTGFFLNGGAMNTISFADDKVGFVAGKGGKIFVTTDGGTSWKDASVAGVRINNIQCIGKDTAFVVADNGGFFRTYNASDVSVTWTAKALKTFDNIYYLNFQDGKNGFLLSNDFIHVTHDGGNTFQKIAIPFYYWSAFDTFGNFNIKLPKITGNILSRNTDISSFLLVNSTSGFNSFKSSVLTLGTGTGGGNGILPVYTNDETLMMYPNPVNKGQSVNIGLSTGSENTVRIYDINSRCLGTFINQVEIPTSFLAPGIYVLRVDQGEKFSVRKLVVK